MPVPTTCEYLGFCNFWSNICFPRKGMKGHTNCQVALRPEMNTNEDLVARPLLTCRIAAVVAVAVAVGAAAIVAISVAVLLQQLHQYQSGANERERPPNAECRMQHLGDRRPPVHFVWRRFRFTAYSWYWFDWAWCIGPIPIPIPSPSPHPSQVPFRFTIPIRELRCHCNSNRKKIACALRRLFISWKSKSKVQRHRRIASCYTFWPKKSGATCFSDRKECTAVLATIIDNQAGFQGR